MSRYKCNKTFTSSNGKKYYYADKVQFHEYINLTKSEQNNFTKESESSYMPGDIFGTGLPGGLDGNFGTSW